MDKYFASLYLAMLGDKIGFGNGDREQNYGLSTLVPSMPQFDTYVQSLTNHMIFLFISEGGITNLGSEINDLKISDDTIMHIGTISGLISDYKDLEELYNIICANYVDEFKDIQKMRDEYLAGRQTIESIQNIKNGGNWRNWSYKKSAGGNGGAMRSMAIGLAFHKPSSQLKLLETAIMTAMITHPNGIAIIGSVVSALFTSYAIQKMNPELWIFELITLLESDKLDNIIEKKLPNIFEYFEDDKKSYLFKLKTYVEDSFTDYNYLIDSIQERSRNSYQRIMYYFDTFTENKKVFRPGFGGDDAIIMAYDALLMSKSNYEKLIYVAMIHAGDTDTIGSISSAWYGALYGFNNVPVNLINLEDSNYNMFKKYSEEIYKKYNI
jgi:ADP-ribosylarginine hydrolase